MKDQLLTSAPQIILAETEIASLINAPGKEKERRLNVQEIAAFLDAIQTHHIWRYTMLALNTLARPDAITDLTWGKIDESGLIDFLPVGRRQNKKFRPTVPASPTLAGWLGKWGHEHDHVITYKQLPIVNPKTAIKKTAATAGLDDVTPYTLRRTMARLLRAEGVPLADIGAMLGHKTPGFNTTEIYADADPNYLKTVTDGIERILDKVSTFTKTASVRVLNSDCTRTAPADAKLEAIYYGQNGRNP